MSVRWMRTIKVKDSKVLEAIAWGKEVCGYAEKKFNTPKIHMWIDSFGEMGTVRWTMDLPDTGAWEKINAQIMMDQDYWKLIHRAIAAGLFIDGTAVDQIFREV